MEFESHQQEATYTVTATLVDPIPPGYGNWTYSWSCYQGSGNYGSGTFDNPAASSTTFRVSGTGLFLPVCNVTGYSLPPVTTGIATGNDSKLCVAIGGPVDVEIQAANEPTFQNDYNDSTQSYFLTYYNYSHASATPTDAQDTQNATASVFDQPGGTTVSWSKPGSTYSSTLLTNPNALSIDLAAEGAFQSAPVKAHFHFSGYGLTGDADDDSSSTEVNKGGIWLPLVYTVSGHEPNHLVGDPNNPYRYTPNNFPPGYQNYASAQVRYKLFDTNGGVMPGVWVQERFSSNPFNLQTNAQTGYLWTTRLVSAPDQSVGDEDGYFQWDLLARYWNGTAGGTTQHEYFAGTKSTTVGAFGISLGVYTITFTPGNPGTATQTP